MFHLSAILPVGSLSLSMMLTPTCNIIYNKLEFKADYIFYSKTVALIHVDMAVHSLNRHMIGQHILSFIQFESI